MENKRPTTLIIFGITGDLASKKILPALYDLFIRGKLAQDMKIVGFSRRSFSEAEIQEFVREVFQSASGQTLESISSDFLSMISYVQGNFDEDTSYTSLAAHLNVLDMPRGGCSDKLFYLSVPPTLYENIVRELSRSGLSIPCGGVDGFSRILIEKPFGNDSGTARALDLLLGELFQEEQIFRIDHYLAKSTLFNIVEERKRDRVFENMLNNEQIEKVEINLFETARVGDRGAFYDGVGSFRDVGQNHMLQMLALLTMDITHLESPAAIQGARADLLSHLMPYTTLYTTFDIHEVTRGQYIGYLQEKGVKENSQTETFFRIPIMLDLPRFKGVPFILSSGKALNENRTEICISFKDKTQKIFTVPGSDSLPAYQKILLDCISGDQTVFTSTEEVFAEWNFVTPIVDMWKSIQLCTYPIGSHPKDIVSE